VNGAAKEKRVLEPHSASPVPRWKERLAALRNTLPIFKMVWEASPGIVVANIGVRLIVSLLPLAMLAVTKVIIDSIYRYTANHTALPTYFWWLVAGEFALACISTILVRITDYCDTVLADKYAKHISVRIMQHASRLDLTSYEDPTFQDKLERARVQGTDRVLMIQAAGRLIQQVVTTASLAFSICLFSPWLLVALIMCVVPAFLGETHFAFLGYSLSFAQTPARREMEYLRVLGGSKESAKELKLFGLGPYFVDRFTKLAMRLHRETAQLARKRLLVGSLLTLLGTLGYYGTYAFVIYQTVAGVLTIGMLTFLAGAIAGASSNIQLVFSTFSTIADQALFVGDLLDFFAVKPAVSSKANALRVPRPIQQGFEFRNVSFAYPNGREVLSGVSFKLAPGERIALVGENGQGKTTIVKLLTRLYDPSAGQILLDGVNLRDYDQEDLWREIGVIFQDFMRYDMTATENIAMGRIEEKDNIFRIRSAAQKSLAEDVIRKLPKGYDQQLGCRFDGGTDLSGGEWQKLALARAYLREAQVLILDEPTASLDAKSEHEVFERFAELTRGKMAMLISHRFSTVRMADRIFVLQGGRIAEEGSHDLLMKNGGRYAEMFELQAASYR
jgi:ATP-binding cassette, subfamily B, bacterial